jgi:hypothetical protein
VKYLWADDRALPAEIENRTAMVPSIFLEVPFLYTFERGDFLFRAGGGLGFLIRYAFLEFGVDADEKSYEEDLSAGQQVARINRYLWSDARWVYPTLQGEMTYRLENGWGAGLTLRVGIPIFNLWATPSVPFADSLMVMVAVTITPPRATKPAPQIVNEAVERHRPLRAVSGAHGDRPLVHLPLADDELVRDLKSLVLAYLRVHSVVVEVSARAEARVGDRLRDLGGVGVEAGATGTTTTCRGQSHTGRGRPRSSRSGCR